MKKLTLLMLIFLIQSSCDKQVELKSDDNKIKISLSEIKESLKNKNISNYKENYFIKSIVFIDKNTPIVKGEEIARNNAKRLMVESKNMRITARKQLKQTTVESKETKEIIFTNNIEQTSTGKLESFEVLDINSEEIPGGVKITLIAKIIYI